ncbi:D-aspartate oxidase [Galleria mellonella]|uniref:D-aspartate oxidase n=1 Tax=Galleria mellonella TaxID=7137 RepID=A0A6J1WVM5_GALME|nr:D-aspartate oxidase [Galleria mellonella]XP_052754443.1 D-aspartate oxidase [Galleria mellonella]
MDKGAPNIAILGAGVVGLTVADILQKDLGKANITIIADKFKEDTTSAVAAGIFCPGSSFRGATREITHKWIDDSWYYWQDILKSSEASNAGIMELSTYIFARDNYELTKNPLLEHLVSNYRAAREDELKLCGPGWKYGSYFTTVKIGCDRYLPWVERRFVDKGGRIVSGKVDSFTSLRQYDLVFNCTGLGAKYLCNDFDIFPLRGQVIRVKAPWLKTAFFCDYDTYIIPGMDGVTTLGGVRQHDNSNLQVCKYDAHAIWQQCCEILPDLRKAEIIGHNVGLRPYRVPVRVEPEVIGGVKVVHCYGHGANGVMSSPGTALNAVKIGYDYLKSNIRNKL